VENEGYMQPLASVVCRQYWFLFYGWYRPLVSPVVYMIQIPVFRKASCFVQYLLIIVRVKVDFNIRLSVHVPAPADSARP